MSCKLGGGREKGGGVKKNANGSFKERTKGKGTGGLIARRHAR